MNDKKKWCDYLLQIASKRYCDGLSVSDLKCMNIKINELACIVFDDNGKEWLTFAHHIYLEDNHTAQLCVNDGRIRNWFSKNGKRLTNDSYGDLTFMFQN